MTSDEQPSSKKLGKVGRLIAIVFGAFAVLIVGAGVFVGMAFWHGRTEAKAETASADGTVEKLSYASESSSWIHYRFVVDGKTFVNSEDASMDVKPGSPVTVCYNPKDPTHSSIWPKGHSCPG